MNTRKFPRTMQQAFGPYTDHRIYEPQEPMHKTDRIVVTACGVALVALLVITFFGG